MKKYYLVIFLITVVIPGYCVAQEVGIDMSYDRSNNELTLVLTNKSDKELWVRNQSSLDEWSGSFLEMHYELKNGDSMITPFCLFEFDKVSGKYVPLKELSPRGQLECTFPLSLMGVYVPKKVRLFLLIFYRNGGKAESLYQTKEFVF